MKLSSRAQSPGRPPRGTRDGVATGPRRRPPHRLPTGGVGSTSPTHEEPTSEVDANPPTPVRRRTRRRMVIGVLVGVGMVLLLVEGVAIVRSLSAEDERQLPQSGVTLPLVAPDELPATGALVLSEVRADGSVEVTQWIRSGDGIDRALVTAPGGSAEGVSVTGGRLVAADGTVIADDLTATAEPRGLRFADPTTMVRATYVLRGVAEESGTVAGRVVAQAVSLDLSIPAQTGPTVVVVAAAENGVVRNLACTNARSAVALLRPCGAPDGSRWRVRLPPERRTDRVAAQVDVP